MRWTRIASTPPFASSLRVSRTKPTPPRAGFSFGYQLPQRQIITASRYDPYLQDIIVSIREETFMADSEARLFDATGKNIGTYRLEVMDTFWKRFMGLMGRDDVPIGNAALFRKCSSIHMFFMKVPLDVIWYGASMPDGRVPVLSVARNVKPWQLSFGPKHTHGCLEVAAGTVPKNLDSIEIVAASSESLKPIVIRPDYRDVVRDRIQVTRCADDLPHLGGAAAFLHGLTL